MADETRYRPDDPLLLRGVSAPRPEWLRVAAPSGVHYQALKTLVRDRRLHTVCESARCPNIGECWNSRTATFLILGSVCTRGCGFCAVTSGQPTEYDLDEPRRVAEAVATLQLRYAVVTSVTRDDLADGGAYIFAETIRAIRAQVPDCRVEVLIPDFAGDREALATVVAARPDVLNHNIETVPRLYSLVRPQANYRRSLDVLAAAGEQERHDGRSLQGEEAGAWRMVTKSGIMVGLGETFTEVEAALRDLRAAGVRIATIGQYLRPSPAHLPVQRYWTPAEFAQIAAVGRALGFTHVEAAPLVRSSYHAAVAGGGEREAG
jgi:lipoyl synthase